MILAVVAAGCGSDSAPRAAPTPTQTATPTYPVAYRVAERRLPEVDVEQEGEVVAETEWDDYTALVLMEWLDEAHGIRLDAPQYRDLIPQEDGLTLIVVTGEHAAALRRLDPSEGALRRYYARFTGDGFPEAGEAMLDWLRVFRRATESADDDHVVVLTLLGP